MPLSLKWRTRFVPKIQKCFISWKSDRFNLDLIKMYWGILQVVVEKIHNRTVVIVLSTNVWGSRWGDTISFEDQQNAWLLLFFVSSWVGNSARYTGDTFSFVLQTDSAPVFDVHIWATRCMQNIRSDFSPYAGNKNESFVLWSVFLLLSVKVYSYFI